MNPYHSILDELPALYHSLLPQIFHTLIPPEDMSDCSHCTMQCHGDNPLQLPDTAFYGATKCCTYYPDVPNYLVGEILRDKENPVGRQRIVDAIQHRHSSTPLGVFMPRSYKILYDAMINTGFGKASTLVCPYYVADTQQCAIWANRNSVCSTWFCKVNGREKGKFFWETLMNYLKHVERSLINYVLMEVGYDIHMLTKLNRDCGHDSEENEDLTPEELDGLAMQPALYSQVWQQWEGKELEFYMTASDLVNGLTMDKLASICGVEGQLHHARLASSLQMMTYVPAVLQLNPAARAYRWIRESVVGSGMVEIHLLTNDLTAAVPVVLQIPSAALDLFDGNHRVDEIVAKLKREEGYELEWQTIITLFSYDILIDANTATPLV